VKLSLHASEGIIRPRGRLSARAISN
jgi:hypothetical protein